MAQGIKYNTKQELIDALIALIFPNKKKLITGAKTQQAVLDLAESLWDQGGLVNINVDDSTAEYLEDKLIEGSGITLSVVDNAGVKTIEIASTALGTDEFVKVQADDTTAEFLGDKIIAGTNITINVVDNAGVKTLEISAAGGGGTDELVKVNNSDSTAAFLDAKITGGTNVTVAVVDTFGVKTLDISSTDTDESVKVSATDTTAQYLGDKLVAGDSIALNLLNGGGVETYEVALDLTTLDLFYVDSNNTGGTGSILDPFETIDDAVDAVDAAVSRVTVVIRGGSYTVTKNMWKDANFVFERGTIVNGSSLGVGINALFDQVEEGTSTYAPDVFGQVQYTSNGKGFYNTADQTSVIRNPIRVSFDTLDVTSALPIYLGQGPYPSGTQVFNIAGNRDGNRGEIILRGTGSHPHFKTKLNGAAQFIIKNIFFNDQTSANSAGTGIVEIGDQPFGFTDTVDNKFQINASLAAPKNYYILLEGVGDGFLIDGMESSNNLQNQSLTAIKILGTTPSTALQLRNVSLFNTNLGAGSYFISGSNPDFIMSNILSTMPFDGAVTNYINEASSGDITVAGITYIPNGDLRQITQIAPTLPEQYVNKDYVDVRTGLPVFDTEGAAAALATGTIYQTSTGELRIKL